MNHRRMKAFGDELTKIAFYGAIRKGYENELEKIAFFGAATNAAKTIGKGLGKAIGVGWHGVKDVANPELEQKFLGFGKAHNYDKMSLPGKAFDQVTSLGGATKYLPVGAKSMMLLGAGMQAREALKPEDPTGRQRSKAERLTGLAANTVGGLAGVGMAMKVMPKNPFIANVVGGIGGGLLADNIATSPWKKARSRRIAQARVEQNRLGMQANPVGPQDEVPQ